MKKKVWDMTRGSAIADRVTLRNERNGSRGPGHAYFRVSRHGEAKT